MACKYEPVDFKKYTKQTQFKESQIRQFYLYFQKYTKPGTSTLSLNEFKKSLGILGVDSNEFISTRLFEIISKEKSSQLSFDSYLSFLNLVNFGTMEDKVAHSFKFFDTEGKGYITKEDFQKTIISVCKYFASITSTQMKIKNSDVDVLYDEIIEKAESEVLDLNSFIHVSNSHPEILDFFDIFNNKLVNSLTFVVQKETLRKLEDVEVALKLIIDKADRYKMENKYDITLALKSFVQNSLKEKKILNDMYHRETTRKGGRSNMPDDTMTFDSDLDPQKKLFISGMVENKLNDFSDGEIDFSESFEKEEHDANSEYLNTEKESIKLKVEPSDQIIIEHDPPNEDYQFISPSNLDEVKDEDIKNEILYQGIDIKNCLIITNKKAFLKMLQDLKNSVGKIVGEINPNKREKKRRKGINIRFTQKDLQIEKDDFLNSTLAQDEEKGCIHFGNENVELVLNMMLGIRNSVNSIGNSKGLYNLDDSDETFKEINRFKFNQLTTDKEHQIKFYDYAPKVFYNIRKLYGITNEQYIKSLGPENFLGNLILTKNRSLREMCSAGKSGSFFYYSYDSKYVLKTISIQEYEFFHSILKDYYKHMYNNPNSLMQRFFGMHVMIFNNVKMHFVIMNNVFDTNIQVHFKYDLKGSTFQRLSRKKEDESYSKFDFNIPMKDLDFVDRKEKVNLLYNEKEMFLNELEKDSKFLASLNINDYSLLIGIHDPDFYNGNNGTQNPKLNKSKTMFKIANETIRNTSYLLQQETGISRKPFNEVHKGGILSRDGKRVFFVGIIDLFTQYGAKKKFEHFFKSMTQGKGISCQPPSNYSERFIQFVKKEVINQE